MRAKFKIGIIALIFGIPVVASYFTESSIYVMPLVYVYWLLLLTSVITVIIFQHQMFVADRYTFRLLHPGEPSGKIICFVTSFNEDPEMLLKTLIAVKNSNPSGEVWLLDDSTDQVKVARIQANCEKLAVKFVHRDSRRGYKAGAINDALKEVSPEYEFLAVFDADQMPTPRFFNGITGYFQDKKIAVVQLPQSYTSIQTNISRASFYQQEVFLRKIMRARNGTSAFILGSGFVARIESIRSVNGFFEENVTEDLATSLLLQGKGWKIVYVDSTEIWYGRPPETVSAYLKQQSRWSLGGFQSIFLMMKVNLSLDQFTDYFAGWLYWLWVGPVRLLSLFSLVLFLDFRLFTIFVNPIFFTIFYFPYFIYSMLFYYYTTSDGVMSYGIRGFFLHQGAELLLMFTVTSSFISFILGRKKPFVVTPKGVAGTYSFGQALPMIAIELIMTVSFVFGLIWLKSTTVPILRVAIYLNLFFAMYLIPFLIAASVLIFTSNYKGEEAGLLAKSA
ncbi:MAG: hypothetical protein AMDU1_APLC00007G0004 [Thermoplasmatales archaeon A-plasma]|jgi:cellulose synthase (UDP-forming)|nr:MAG: hypothetical protein AMDU1_APLC00007G0004 [Thermoplasmatales archaeon A-plasma]